MEITGLEANLLLFTLDIIAATDREGKITKAYHGYTFEEMQDLRDRLFGAHEHPDEDE
jgi:hypothetical protein